MKQSRIQILIFTGLLVAIGVVLTYFLSITIPPTGAAIIRFGIGYVPLIFISILYGPLVGVMAGIVQDILGIFLIGAPIFSYTFHPIFTLNAAIYGWLPGWLFRMKLPHARTVFFWLNNSMLLLFLVAIFVYVFNIDRIHSETLGETEKWVLLGLSALGVVATGLVNVIVFFRQKKVQDGTKLLFVVMALYMIVSLGITPMFLAFRDQVSYWAYLPVRILKMPIEVAIYVIILSLIMNIFRQLNKEAVENS